MASIIRCEDCGKPLFFWEDVPLCDCSERNEVTPEEIEAREILEERLVEYFHFIS